MKTLSIIFLFVIMFIIWMFVGTVGSDLAKSIFNPPAPVTKDNNGFIQQKLIIAAQEANKNTPQMLNDSTRMEKVEANTSNLTLTYYITYINLTSNDTDFAFIQKQVPDLTNFACNNEDMKRAMSQGVSYIYALSESNGNEITKVKISETNCK